MSVETYFGKNNGNGLDYKDNKIDTMTAPDSLLAFGVDYEAKLAAKRAASSAQPTTSATRPPKKDKQHNRWEASLHRTRSSSF